MTKATAGAGAGAGGPPPARQPCSRAREKIPGEAIDCPGERRSCLHLRRDLEAIRPRRRSFAVVSCDRPPRLARDVRSSTSLWALKVPATARALMLGAFALSTLDACMFLFDFDGYDTSRPPPGLVLGDGAVVNPETGEVGTFELVVPESLEIPWQGESTASISIKRIDGFDKRVTVSVADPQPKGIAPVTASTIEASSTSTTLAFKSLGTASLSQVVTLVATSGPTTKTASLKITVAAHPCALDTSFGELKTGFVSLWPDGAAKVQLPLEIRTSGSDMIAAYVDENGPSSVDRIDSTGKVQHIPAAPAGTKTITADGQSVLMAVGLSGERLAVVRAGANGALDTTFGKGDASVSGITDPASMAAGMGTPRYVISGTNLNSTEWRVAALDNTGAVATAFGDAGVARVNFAAGVTAPTTVFFTSTNGVVACGSAGVQDNRPTLTRWTSSGALDVTFGGTGSVRLDGSGSGVRCAPLDGDRAVVVGAPKLSVVALASNGQVDPTFAANVAKTAPALASLPGAQDVAVDVNGRVTILLMDGKLVRLESDGRLDAVFGPGGVCDLPAQSPPNTTGRRLAVADGDRLVVLAQVGVGGVSVARLVP